MKPAPKKVPNREAKVIYLQWKQGFRCPIAAAFGQYAGTGNELHHAGVHNTKTNRLLYPKFIHSVWNLMLVSHKYHMMHGSFGRISDIEAAKREAFLEAHPCIAKKLNMEE